MRRSQPKLPATPEPELHTYDVLKPFWHEGRLITPEQTEIKANGLRMSEARARFNVLNGVLAPRKPEASPAKTKTTGKGGAD